MKKKCASHVRVPLRTTNIRSPRIISIALFADIFCALEAPRNVLFFFSIFITFYMYICIGPTALLKKGPIFCALLRKYTFFDIHATNTTTRRYIHTSHGKAINVVGVRSLLPIRKFRL